ncbi:MAG: macro domain-containing protein [Aggregatilineales bacterium]
MLTFVHADLFYSPARVLVNPVNTVGSMGSGISYDFKRFYPAMYEQYRELCEADDFQPGQLMLYRTPHKWVLNFPTKRHYRAKDDPDAIEQGLQKFAATYADMGITSVSFPMLADNIAWDDLRALLKAYLAPLPISVFVHVYNDANPDIFETGKRNIRGMRAWLQGQPQQPDFEQFWRDLVKALKSHKKGLVTYDDEAFTLIAEARQKKRRVSLKLTPEGEKQIFIPETLLQDMWRYIVRAGYVLPQNLPGGLDIHAPYMVRLLSELKYLNPVHLSVGNSEKVVGLQYIPMLNRKSSAMKIDMAGDIDDNNDDL